MLNIDSERIAWCHCCQGKTTGIRASTGRVIHSVGCTFFQYAHCPDLIRCPNVNAIHCPSPDRGVGCSPNPVASIGGNKVASGVSSGIAIRFKPHSVDGSVFDDHRHTNVIVIKVAEGARLNDRSVAVKRHTGPINAIRRDSVADAEGVTGGSCDPFKPHPMAYPAGSSTFTRSNR